MTWFKKLTNQDEAGAPLEEMEMAADETAGEDSEGELAVDVFQDGDDIILQSTAAGVKPEDIDITISSDSVTIRGERKRQFEAADTDHFYQECYWGNFSRTVSLPVEIDVDKAAADIKDGILTLTLPKAGRTRTKKVRVKSAEE